MEGQLQISDGLSRKEMTDLEKLKVKLIEPVVLVLSGLQRNQAEAYETKHCIGLDVVCQGILLRPYIEGCWFTIGTDLDDLR